MGLDIGALITGIITIISAIIGWKASSDASKKRFLKRIETFFKGDPVSKQLASEAYAAERKLRERNEKKL